MNKLAKLFQTELRRVNPKVWHYIHSDSKTKPYQVFAVELRAGGQRFFGGVSNEKRAQLFIAVTADDAETIDEIISNAIKHFDRYQYTTSDGLRIIKMESNNGAIQYSETKKQFTGFHIFSISYSGQI